MRRSRRKGQLRRTCSILARSHSATQRFLGGGAGARDHFAERIDHEGVAPELELAFDADAIDRRDEDAVGDRVAALNRLPRVDLFGADFLGLAMPPSDGRGIEQDLRTRHRGQTRGLGEPLIPAYEHADRTARGRMRDEVEIAGGEVVFFVVARIVGDMHLAVAADDYPGLVDDGGGVVIDAGRAALEDRRDDNYFARLGDGAERFSGRAGNRLGEIEKFRILDLTRILAAEQLLRADDVGAALGGVLDFGDGLVEIEARLGRTTHLDEPNGDLVRLRCHDNCDSNRASPTPSCRTIALSAGTKHFWHRRLHERGCDTVIGRAKGKRAGAILGTARR